ncbi:MAG: dienelactone hydrolase family protein [Planctomycetota bacterium]|jgi:carboxymethylenebutenolidase|nr:MAG: dienelactone hydrolase family protein [Planctomycetota bacterium]
MLRLLMAAVAAIYLAAGASAQDWAKAALEKSPRHGEWVELKHNDRKLKAFVVFPEVSKKATTVLVIHEIFGLSDWVRLMADDLAAAGYIAIAPDLLSGTAPGGGGTDEFKSGDAVRKAIMTLPPDQITADLKASLEHVATLPASNGKVAVAGFCWGGTQAFRFAANSEKLKASFPFYGSAPTDLKVLERIQCPVHGFYGGNDNRINSTLDKTSEQMKAAGKKFEPVLYDQAGHGFMRAGQAPDASEPNKKGRKDAIARLTKLLEGL